MFSRRAFLAAAAAASLRASESKWKIGVFNGPLRLYDPSVFDVAKRAGADGVELRATDEKEVDLRKPGALEPYLEAAKRTNLPIPSIAANFMNAVSIHSDPSAPARLAEAILLASRLGAKVILIPTFDKNEIRKQDTAGFERACSVLREIAPEAAKAGVVLARESYLPAVELLPMLERVGRKEIGIYFDTGNSGSRGMDVPAEIRQLAPFIHSVHLKDLVPVTKGPRKPMLFREETLPLAPVIATLREIKYEGWLVLETFLQTDQEAGLRHNLEYVRRHMR